MISQKVAIITVRTKGIDFGIARKLVKEWWVVVIMHHSSEDKVKTKQREF